MNTVFCLPHIYFIVTVQLKVQTLKLDTTIDCIHLQFLWLCAKRLQNVVSYLKCKKIVRQRLRYMLQYLSTQDNKPCQVLFSSGFPFLSDNFYQYYKFVGSLTFLVFYLFHRVWNKLCNFHGNLFSKYTTMSW